MECRAMHRRIKTQRWKLEYISLRRLHAFRAKVDEGLISQLSSYSMQIVCGLFESCLKITSALCISTFTYLCFTCLNFFIFIFWKGTIIHPGIQRAFPSSIFRRKDRSTRQMIPSKRLKTVKIPPTMAQTVVRKDAKDLRSSLWITAMGEISKLKKTPSGNKVWQTKIHK